MTRQRFTWTSPRPPCSSCGHHRRAHNDAYGKTSGVCRLCRAHGKRCGKFARNAWNDPQLWYRYRHLDGQLWLSPRANEADPLPAVAKQAH
jgi:predicted amidophosphoribosyltransferase